MELSCNPPFSLCAEIHQLPAPFADIIIFHVAEGAGLHLRAKWISDPATGNASIWRGLPVAFENTKRSKYGKYVTQTKGGIHAYMTIHAREISEGFILFHSIVFLY